MFPAETKRDDMVDGAIPVVRINQSPIDGLVTDSAGPLVPFSQDQNVNPLRSNTVDASTSSMEIIFGSFFDLLVCYELRILADIQGFVLDVEDNRAVCW
jgi:hypothetical protein